MSTRSRFYIDHRTFKRRAEAYEEAPGLKVANLRERGSIEELTMAEKPKGDRSDYEDTHQCLVPWLAKLLATTEGNQFTSCSARSGRIPSCNETRL